MKAALLHSKEIKSLIPNMGDNPLLEKEEIEILLKMGFKISSVDHDDITFIYNHGSKTDLEYQDL